MSLSSSSSSSSSDDAIEDDVSPAFITALFHARCDDLDVAPSPAALTRFTLIINRKLSTSSSSFDLSSSSLGPASSSCITTWLVADDALTALNLSSNHIGNVGAVAVADLVRRHRHLHHLDVSANDITADGFIALADALPSSSLTTLIIANNKLGAAGADALSSSLPLSSIVDLRLANVVGAASVVVADAIVHLDLSQNRIDDDVIVNIARSTTITNVSLAKNEIGDGSTRAMAMLMSSTSMRSVDVVGNHLGRAFAMTIIDRRPMLTTLLLDGNPRIGSAGDVIVEAVMMLTTLTTLSLSRCSLNTPGIVSTLLHHPQLRRLCMSSNAIGDHHDDDLASALADNDTLVVLDLSSNAIGDRFGKALAEGVRRNTTLQELILKDNDVGDDTAAAMLLAIREAPRGSLQRLALQLNGVAMRLSVDIDNELRCNKTIGRQVMIATFHADVESLREQRRQLRATITTIADELARRTIDNVRDDVKSASTTFQAFVEGEEQETRRLQEDVERRSGRCRKEINALKAHRDQMESDQRKAYRTFVGAAHRIDVKVVAEQNKKGTAFRALRALQKEVHQRDEVVRDEKLLQSALTRQLRDERDARRWVEAAAIKWSERIAKLTKRIISEYSKGIQTYLETMIAPPLMTNRMKKRWARVRERRWALLVEFQPELFLKWFQDPLRPTSIRREDDSHHHHRGDADVYDPNSGYTLHVKVATTPSMISPQTTKLIHSSHSVYSMSLHSIGRHSSIVVALSDDALALEFGTIRGDVANLVIHAAGHQRIEALRAIIADRIGVDQSDIAGLYHEVTSRPTTARRFRKKPPALSSSSSSSALPDGDGDDDETRNVIIQSPSSKRQRRSQRRRRLRHRPIDTKATTTSRATRATALEQAQELFPSPDSDVDLSTPAAPHPRSSPSSSPHDSPHPSLPRDHHPPTPQPPDRRRSEPSSRRRPSVPLGVGDIARRRLVDLMPWSYQHNIIITSSTTPPPSSPSSSDQDEHRLLSELAAAEATLGPAHPGVSAALATLGQYYTRRHRFGEAERAFARALAIRTTVFGRRHPHVAAVQHQMASMLAVQPGRRPLAEALLVKAVSARERALGVNSPIVADSLMELGRLYGEDDDRERAGALFGRALTIRRRIYGKRHGAVVEALEALGGLDGSRRGRDDEGKRTTVVGGTNPAYKMEEERGVMMVKGPLRLQPSSRPIIVEQQQQQQQQPVVGVQ